MVHAYYYGSPCFQSGLTDVAIYCMVELEITFIGYHWVFGGGFRDSFGRIGGMLCGHAFYHFCEISFRNSLLPPMC